MSSANKTAYIIAGPTAVGKTAIAIALAQRLGTEIVSADSRQCYKGMTIGTAKPSAEELGAVKHYFIDEFSVTTSLTAADYEQLALKYLNDILSRHDTAVVCGGTGLYIKALCEGLDEMPETDPDIAAQTQASYKEHGITWLQEALQREDPEFYAKGEVQNPARILRALSFVRTTGKSIMEYRTRTKKERPFRIVKVALELPRELLYERINQRVLNMMEAGLVGEVTALKEYQQLKNLQTVGYAEIFAYLNGEMTLHDATQKIMQHTRNYAKRQLTWFKKDEEFTWFRADDTLITEKILAL
ncbi:MAG: tRNA (adenosine(37)-N6)-dimethylallyltransferase MiaA [Bacteroidota bacterium]